MTDEERKQLIIKAQSRHFFGGYDLIEDVLEIRLGRGLPNGRSEKLVMRFNWREESQQDVWKAIEERIKAWQ